MYIYCHADVHSLLHLPTSMHQALPSPAQSTTFHFQCSLKREARSLTLVCLMTDCIPRYELLQRCGSKRSPIRLVLQGWWSCWESCGSSCIQLGLAQPWGQGGTEQDVSGAYLSFMAGHFGGRKAGKRPALFMLQEDMVSMATPPAFPYQGWMPQGERWHSNQILGGWGVLCVWWCERAVLRQCLASPCLVGMLGGQLAVIDEGRDDHTCPLSLHVHPTWDRRCGHLQGWQYSGQTAGNISLVINVHYWKDWIMERIWNFQSLSLCTPLV